MLGKSAAGKVCLALQVPIPLYFMTHAYFCFYHAISNMAIRATRHLTAKHGALVQHLSTALTIFLLSYATAYMETLTIAHFPYYKFKVHCLPCLGSILLTYWPIIMQRIAALSLSNLQCFGRAVLCLN